MSKKFIVGIDLGTTNCVLSYIDIDEIKKEQSPPIKVMEVLQLVAPKQIDSLKLLPSFIYLPTQAEKDSNALTTPWDPFADRVIGKYARERGAEVPSRLISSAKSWLCHPAIDRNAPILPIDAPSDCTKLSPIAAQASLLRHLKASWNQTIGKQYGAPLEEQEIYLTIPASFDAVARELTVQASRAAGLENITLLEEPQAAFYAWLFRQGEGWRDKVKAGDLILVCDIGGGTTDFSLIKVDEKQGELSLERILVGDHLLLGGDNMDLALAHEIAKGIAKKLDRLQMQSLWHNARIAKERLLDSDDIDEVPVVITGRGSGLIGGTIRTSLKREQLESVILNGFFPICPPDEMPISSTTVGLKELGLPYAQDSAISRHLAAFLTKAKKDSPYTPSFVLFNGGVMKARLLRRRIVEILSYWSSTGEIKSLAAPELDLAVAQGACFYGVSRKIGGIRIRGGLGRSYYIGLEGTRPAIPGIAPDIKALCIVNQTMEEGQSVELPERVFGLVVGRQVEFKFMGSSIRREDKPGDIIEDWEQDIKEISTVSASIDASGLPAGTIIPVVIRAKVTEVGTLALSLVSTKGDIKFDLEFNVRG